MKLIERLTLRARILGALGLCSFIYALVYTAFWGFERRLALSDPRPIDKSLAEDLWFTPDGALISLQHQDKVVLLKKWPSHDLFARPSEVSLTFAEEIQVEPRNSMRADYANAPSKWVPYAISVDADQVAWWWNGFLFTKNIGVLSPEEEGRTDSVSLNNNRAVEALSFIEKSAIAVLYSDGRLETWDFDSEHKGHKGRRGTVFDGKYRLWTRGPRMALSAFDSTLGDVALVDFSANSKLAIELQTGFLNGSSLALSPKGRLVVGTTDGFVVDYSENVSVPLEVSRAINAMACYGEHKIIVGGDFPGIFMVDLQESLISRRLAPSPGIRLMALSNKYLAYSTLRATVVAKVHPGLAVTPAARTTWKWVLAIIAILGFVLAVVRDQRDNLPPSLKGKNTTDEEIAEIRQGNNFDC